MKLGLGLYRSMLTEDNFRFAKQAGATHLVVHLTDYFNAADSLSTGSGDEPWGVTQNQDKLWTAEELTDLRKSINAAGLELAALENFDPSHWYDVLLDGPQKMQQIEGIKQMIRNMGAAGIPCMECNFSRVQARVVSKPTCIAQVSVCHDDEQTLNLSGARGSTPLCTFDDNSCLRPLFTEPLQTSPKRAIM